MADGYTPDPADVDLIAEVLKRHCLYCAGGYQPGRCEVHVAEAELALSALAAVGRLQTAALDDAMHSVWLHGNWRWLTTQMTTAAKEAAADAVDRHTATYPPDDRGEPVERWWRPVPVPGSAPDADLTRQLLSLTVAIRQAEMVLRMVAACMADEPTPAPVVPQVTPDPDLPATPDAALTADGRAALTQDLQRMARDRRLAADADLTRHRLLTEHREDTP